MRAPHLQVLRYPVCSQSVLPGGKARQNKKARAPKALCLLFPRSCHRDLQFLLKGYSLATYQIQWPTRTSQVMVPHQLVPRSHHRYLHVLQKESSLLTNQTSSSAPASPEVPPIPPRPSKVSDTNSIKAVADSRSLKRQNSRSLPVVDHFKAPYKDLDFSKMDSLAQLTLQRELEQVIEKERRKQAKASERHKKRVSFIMKNGSRE